MRKEKTKITLLFDEPFWYVYYNDREYIFDYLSEVTQWLESNEWGGE
jgi:hypothetical protein